jgi:outer membrane protein assembly factor BamA
MIGGWREATQGGFFGVGNATSKDDRANYSFEQPYGSAALEVRRLLGAFLVRGAADVARWNVGAGSGSAPPVDEIYTADTLPGLGARTTYVHTEGTLGFDTRPSPGYARRGTFLGVTFHDFHDVDGRFGFRRTDYEAIQHLPLMRETWVLSLHGRVELANAADEQTIPFFMLPALGGGSSLRGFSSWRFRDRNSLLLQAEWRLMANRFLDVALVYDAGRVADRREDLTSAPLKSDYGVGFRFHGPLATPLRVEFVKSNEGLSLVFSAKAAF